jgi:hypothetical protein
VPGHGIKAPVLAFITDLHWGSACSLASSLSAEQALSRIRADDNTVMGKEWAIFIKIILGQTGLDE